MAMSVVFLLLWIPVEIGSLSNRKLLQSLHGADGPEWNLQEIEDYLGVTVPREAIEISYNSERRAGFWIKLRFQAPPEHISQFTDGICNGILYQGYDPFNAIDTAKPLPDVHLIKSSEFTYYSYSPDLPRTYSGNRCHNGLILVDKTNSDFYAVRFEISANCNTPIQLPCLPLGRNVINPMPGLPLMVTGMAETEAGYLLITEEFCVEARGDYLIFNSTDYDGLIGARVEIFLDNKLVASPFISNGYRLASKPDEKDSNFHPLFNYCFIETWKSGENHAMTITVTKPSGEIISPSWEFKVQ